MRASSFFQTPRKRNRESLLFFCCLSLFPPFYQTPPSATLLWSFLSRFPPFKHPPVSCSDPTKGIHHLLPFSPYFFPIPTTPVSSPGSPLILCFLSHIPAYKQGICSYSISPRPPLPPEHPFPCFPPPPQDNNITLQQLPAFVFQPSPTTPAAHSPRRGTR